MGNDLGHLRWRVEISRGNNAYVSAGADGTGPDDQLSLIRKPKRGRVGGLFAWSSGFPRRGRAESR